MHVLRSILVEAAYLDAAILLVLFVAAVLAKGPDPAARVALAAAVSVPLWLALAVIDLTTGHNDLALRYVVTVALCAANAILWRKRAIRRRGW